MSDFQKTGAAQGLSRFAKLGIALTVALVLAVAGVAYRINATYAAVTAATEEVWDQIAASDPAIASINAGETSLSAAPVWGVDGSLDIQQRTVWELEASSSGQWTGPDGQTYGFVAYFVRIDDRWQLARLVFEP